MEKLTSEKALELLTEGIIKEDSDYQKPENRWINHCINVGIAAGRIAERLGEDVDYAKALGYIHDIGRRISHPNHPIDGYRYMYSKGYVVEAGICLTHSFINNDICMAIGDGPHGDAAIFLSQFLSTHSVTVCDNIIQLCDLFCTSEGFTTLENRMLDITKRKGTNNHSKIHFLLALQLQKQLEQRMNCSLEELFPEIKDSDLKSRSQDQEELLAMIENANKNKVKTY